MILFCRATQNWYLNASASVFMRLISLNPTKDLNGAYFIE
jgi:hypothetical protein